MFCVSFTSWALISVVVVVVVSNQVEASTNQVADHQMPVYNLPAKILCRVVNLELKVSHISKPFLHVETAFLQLCTELIEVFFNDLQAELDTDEVYAQITLFPEPNVS